MKHALAQLNKTSGVLGSAVLAPDGLVIASQASTELEDEEMWQHALRAFQAFAGLAEACGCGETVSAALEWENGKLVVRTLPQGILLAAADSACPLGPIQVAVDHAAAAICATGVEQDAAA